MGLFSQGDTILARLSKTKYLTFVTFCVAFLEATISPLLPEAFLLIVLAYRKDVSWKYLSLISSLGSSFGAMSMYILGMKFYTSYGDKVIIFLHGESVAEKAKLLFAQNAFASQFFAALTPLPDRVFSFLAGAFLVSPLIIFAATFLGRLVRVAPVAYLSHEYGDEARIYIKKHTKKVTYGVLIILLLYVIYSYFS